MIWAGLSAPEVVFFADSIEPTCHKEYNQIWCLTSCYLCVESSQLLERVLALTSLYSAKTLSAPSSASFVFQVKLVFLGTLTFYFTFQSPVMKDSVFGVSSSCLVSSKDLSTSFLTINSAA